MTTTHYRTCTLCEAMCGLALEAEDGRVVSIRGDADDPFSRGHICPKGAALGDVHADPDRVRQPLRRTSAGWHPVSWDEALDEAAERLRGVQAAHGRDAVAVYQGNPTVHNYGSLLYAPGFVRALGTRNRFSATSVDQLPHHLAAYLMFGHFLQIPIPDLHRTDFFLVLGANPAVSNGSMMSAPDAAGRIRAIRRRGGTVVVIDPRRSETAALANRHHFIRPGTDALLLLALLHVVFAEGLEQPGRLGDLVDGLDTVRALVADFPPERVAAATEIAAEEIRALARAFAAAPSAVCYGRCGVSTQEFGGLAHWLINLLNLATGNLDRPGGAMFTEPAVDVVKQSKRGSFGRWKSRVRGLPEFSGELPVAALAEEILTPGPGQVRALVTSAGNPVLSTPNGAQLDRALAGLDFMVSVDFYLNETTRHAHLILPPTSPLEHDHYDLAFYLLAVRNAARYSPALFPAPAGALHDWQIFLGLQRRLERGTKARLRHAALARLGPHGMLDLGLRTGPYGAGFKPFGRGLTLRRLRAQPHGVDLGPLRPALPARLFTRDGRIHAAPAPLLADVARLRARLLEGLEHLPGSAGANEFAAGRSQGPPARTPVGEPRFEADSAGGYDLLLIGRRQLRSNNSWMHNYPRLMKGRDRCTLVIHPDDAAVRGITEDAPVRLSSRAGSVEVPAELSEDVMPGVVSLPHGFGHGRGGIGLAVAAAHPGASANDVTDDLHLDALTGNAALNGIPVRVEVVVPTAAAAPPIVIDAARA
jgi:anaerobic selenocysteine-containing dehydrogenase